MKSSEERIDEELRKALRERFDHFERLPDPALRDKVLKGLSGGKSLVQTGVIASLLLLMAVTAVVYFGSLPTVEKSGAVAITSDIARYVPEKSTAAKDVQSAVKPIRAQQQDQTEEHTKIAVRPVVNRPVETVTTEKIVNADPVRRAPGMSVRATRRPVKPYRITREDLVKIVETAKSNSSFGSLWIQDDVITPGDRSFLESELKKAGFGDTEQDSVVIEQNHNKVLEGPSVADQDIGVLDHRPLALPQYEWEPDSLVTPGKPKKRYEYLFKERWTIVAGITPLRTFQILTVRPGNGVVYQNFVLPSKISAATVGYKFSAGVERKGFQLLLNYGQFKQSYRYEIATGEFVVGPDLSGNYEVVRKGIPQEQNSTVRLVGMSIKKHIVRRSHFLRNYFGDVGAEFSRDLTSEKNLVWLNAGFGKELFAGNNVVMTVGPYFEYSVSKLRNPDNPFKIQPYQIGLSVGLRYTKK
ncbi:hypothetical protein LZD49_06845 [Dyadobacter sp. CY261]|uniref:hypothetical protein n=1 Tax=Dyadobacter sp. CY261 TaxID=2907203 RepID=UPI001F3CF9BB|nr:hypothetical protein [Dyadobacter sp. CY261]MCF0070182.1 hypothetical protein [Dyadobacter sp. CY261]